ncbi:MAG: hypothetical protein M0Q51_13410 [Bacteroidales bacterium]|nr:hypothetical protein [Bacteroidales bacterium]
MKAWRHGSGEEGKRGIGELLTGDRRPRTGNWELGTPQSRDVVWPKGLAPLRTALKFTSTS